MNIHLAELDLIRSLHQLRTPMFDAIFIACNYIDTFSFTASIVVLVFLFGRRRIALKMAIIMTMSFLVNKGLKYTFGLPRPFNLDPSLTILTTKTPGFPSGAAQTSVIFLGIILYEWKSPWRWIVGPLFAIILSFSRVYLGLHFPTDILGGWIVGAALFWVYVKMDNLSCFSCK